jgi:splicing factor 1
MAENGRRRFVWGPIPAGAAIEAAPALPPPPADAPAAGSAEPAPKRRRRSRWEDAGPAAAAAAAADDSRALTLFPTEIVLSNGLKISLPPALTGRHASGDPEVVKLHTELADVERALRGGAPPPRPEAERSPSPPPTYGADGQRLNTREVRWREKTARRKQALIEELLRRDPAFRAPADFKPEKKMRKLFIPYRQFPDYNFIGLIIGPRGMTQKKMQAETNTRIAIRGRGSVKEGAARNPNHDYGEEDDLHVLVAGDREEDVEAAARMVAHLLQPTDDATNEHKQLQLRELARINGTLKDEDSCFLCGEAGHRQVDCPKAALDVYRLPDAIAARAEEQYARDVARAGGGAAAPREAEYRSFLAELGGTDPRAAGAGAPLPPPPSLGGGGGPGREPDSVKLWVGNLAHSVDDRALRALFEPHGAVTRADVAKSPDGAPRGFGFVHFAEEAYARAALAAMHGVAVDGRPLNVRPKGEGGGGGAPPPRAGLGAPGGGYAGGGGGGGRPDDALPPECKLFVGSLPFHVDEAALRREFERFGALVSARVILDRETQRPKGFGFVSFADPACAGAAIAHMDGFMGYDPTARPIAVRQAGTPAGGGGGGGGFGGPPRGPWGGPPPPQWGGGMGPPGGGWGGGGGMGPPAGGGGWGGGAPPPPPMPPPGGWAADPYAQQPQYGRAPPPPPPPHHAGGFGGYGYGAPPPPPQNAGGWGAGHGLDAPPPPPPDAPPPPPPDDVPPPPPPT